MGKLVYLMNVSLDGYVETSDHTAGSPTASARRRRVR
jgi:hypothetical protein